MRTIAFDISTTAIGWGVGEDDVECFGEENTTWDEHHTEGDKFHWVYLNVMGLWIAHDCNNVVVEESNSSVNMHTTRLLLGARGMLVHAFHALNKQPVFIGAGTARKMNGINTGFPRGTSKYMRRKGLKERVIAWAKRMGHDVKTDNEADALCLLYASFEL